MTTWRNCVKQARLLFLFTVTITTFSAYLHAQDEDGDMLTPEQIAFNAAVKNCVLVLEETGIVNMEDRLVERYCQTKILARDRNLGRFAKRIMAEKATELNPFVITPHEISYLMPITITDNFNKRPYQVYDIPISDQVEEINHFTDGMSELEAKYQISLKVPLRTSSLFIRGDAIYFAMTVQAWWQIYSHQISKPFRETNYKPEIFYLAPLPFQLFGNSFGFSVSLEHQSNGQFQGLSRSWNRAHFALIYDTDDWSGGIKLWHRFEEPEKEFPLSAKGDDNPDILDYMGNYEIKLAYAINDDHKLSSTIRKNWQTRNGAIELNYTFPFLGRLRGFMQYFSGYGESLIDYNHKQQKLGFGLALTEIF
ncbi:MAG: phospholipase A [Gammaproteobacteria bacterium]|nr:phospholipase A [Gammaproteobacteria bacterium]